MSSPQGSSTAAVHEPLSSLAGPPALSVSDRSGSGHSPRSTVRSWQERRQERLARPFPSPWRRLRSALGLAVTVLLLGGLIAALIIASLITLVLAGSHLVGG